MKLYEAILTIPLLVCSVADAFSATKLNQRQQVSLQQAANEDDRGTSRRSLLSGALAASFLGAFAAPNTAMAQDEIPITPFNGLIFNYRNSDSYGGLDASTLNEPSVPFKEFAERLQKGEVSFVEFLAPDGDAAYVTFKGTEGKIRVGEGYPLEQHDGWSSPSFVVRAVANNNVPYKFIVPGLEKYRQ